MKPTIYDPKSPKLPHSTDHHSNHADISSVEGDALKRANLPVYGESGQSRLGRKPKHNAVSGEVRTERLF